MEIFKVTLAVKATDKEQVSEKLQAFQDLQDHLQHDDFIQAVEVIVDNPKIVTFIKEVVPEDGKSLSLTDYIGIARKAFVTFSD